MILGLRIPFMEWGWAVLEGFWKSAPLPHEIAARVFYPSARRGGEVHRGPSVSFLPFLPLARILTAWPGGRKSTLHHWVVITSAECQLKSKKTSVPWWFGFWIFDVFHVGPPCHGDLICFFTRCESKKQFTTWNLASFFACFWWACFRVSRHMKIH